ncbi:hypothetical protein [Actinobacillus pleuropneumoniae]|uniref:Uncharacterized protein n=1 Tax=Actinobacillus pleuropneumoniae serotype 7 (strain AP76) TaxID=537457 RepID=B3GX51_ACTP7|nr:hypothetical protein [Actinobacillus pleuropneumoniae]ACE61203.1 hypothetical protein APP7_0551 [Actinobacillus pleuropneumoniae serovar 7 str. AP76]EFN03225.1 hypothetical protein appser13_5620 [Actinobacillus pleuropneumoniae serovar 13 str. N273]
MMTEEYREFLEKSVAQGIKDYEEGRVYTSEQFYERAMKAITQVEKDMQDAA